MKTACCYITHTITDRIVYNFIAIKNAFKKVDKDCDVIFVLTEGKDEKYLKYIGKSKKLKLHLDDVDLIDKTNYKCIHSHIIYNKIYSMIPDYECYWMIEYDVTMNSYDKVRSYSKLFSFYKDNDYDLICSHLHKWDESWHYQKRYNVDLLNEYVQKVDSFLYKDNKVQTEKLWFCFIPIMRISNRLLKITKEYYDSGSSGFFEYVIPSIAFEHNMNVHSFNEDKFVVENEFKVGQEHSINKGSNGWLTKPFKEFYSNYPEDVIIHPVKDKYIKPNNCTVWACCLSDIRNDEFDFMGYKHINQNNPTKAQLNKDNLFFLNKFFSEWSLQYYVWKNKIKSKYVIFCHENKITKPHNIYLNGIDSEHFQTFAILHRCWSAITTEEYCNFLTNALKFKEGWDDIVEYLKQQTIMPVGNLFNGKNKDFLQYEMFCCKWEDFEKYSEFMYGFLEFIMKKYNIEMTFESWANHVKTHYMDKFDPDDMPVWFMLIGYDIYKEDIQKSLRPDIRCNCWRIYSYMFEILSLIYVRHTNYFIYGKNKDLFMSPKTIDFVKYFNKILNKHN